MTTDTVQVVAATFAADTATRTLTGLLLPFGQVSRPALDRTTGRAGRYTFAAGSVTLPDPSDVVLNYGHDGESLNGQVGIATQLWAEDDGIHATFRIAKTPEGDRVLALAEDRILRYFSAEVGGDFDDRDGVRHARTPDGAAITGAAVVRQPAFAGAHITDVAASAADTTTREEPPVGDESTTETAAFGEAQGLALQEQVRGLSEQLAAMRDITIPVGPGERVQVREEPIYRFAGTEPAPSGHDFAVDLLAAARGDQAAFARLQAFTTEEAEARANPEFVTTANVGTVNQPTYRPDMFVGQAPTPKSPMYDTFRKGALTNVTPFFWTKLDRVNTTVGVRDHVEGVEPNPDNLVTATGTTVTPTAVSGKVHITREVADQGGNPLVSGLIKAEFDRSFDIALEQKTGALIQASFAAMTSLTAAIAAGASGITAGRAIEAGLVDLQFLPDGARFTKLFGQQDLYTALTQAILPRFSGDTIGEKAYPIINPQNRDGVQGEKYSFIDLAGYRMEPAASLGAKSTNFSNSLVADPSAVHVWNSGLTRLDKLQEKVEGWDVGVFAYFAGVVYDITGLRKIAYDPTA